MLNLYKYDPIEPDVIEILDDRILDHVVGRTIEIDHMITKRALSNHEIAKISEWCENFRLVNRTHALSAKQRGLV